MNLTANTKKFCSLLIKQMHLPDTFEDIVRNVYLPLAKIIINKKKNQPLLVNINGAQGTGKSTLTTFLKRIIESELACEVAELSLDDFYYTRSERQMLSKQVHSLLITRGVPGTHDIALIEYVLDTLMNHQPCKVPRFDKAMDDRCAESDWTHYNVPVDIILFEGWCNNSPFQSPEELVQPVNELEVNEDPQGIWRHYANEQLKDYHKHLFSQAEMSIMLNASDFDRVYQWRYLQEQKLRASASSLKQQHLMSDTELRRFIQHYERITQHTLSHLPAMADVVLPVAADHSITGIIQNHV